MSYTTYLIILAVFLVVGIILYFTVKRNYFNKYKYVRLVKYNKDMSIKVFYIKRKEFNKDGAILINEKHVFNFKGYTSIIITDNSNETINPLDFDSKFDSTDYKSAIRSKLIKDTFESLKVDKFDKIMMLIVLNIAQLIAIAYLLYMLMGGGDLS